MNKAELRELLKSDADPEPIIRDALADHISHVVRRSGPKGIMPGPPRRPVPSAPIRPNRRARRAAAAEARRRAG